MAVAVVPTFAQAQSAPTSNWNFAAGAGVATYPRFPGSKESRILPVPILTATYKDFFFADTVRGIGVQDEVLSGLTLSAAIGMSVDERRAKDSARLDDLKSISVAPDVLLGAHYAYERAFIDLGLSERVGRQERKGGLLSVDLGLDLVSNAGLNLAAGVTAHAMDKNYAHNFFGIDAAQSAASGLPTFAAKAGLKDAGLFVQGQYQINSNWSLSSRIAAVKLEGDAGRSPITERRLQPSVYLAATRSF